MQPAVNSDKVGTNLDHRGANFDNGPSCSSNSGLQKEKQPDYFNVNSLIMQPAV